MIIENLIFYALCGLIVLFSLLAVTSRRIIRAATFLLIVLVATAGIYLLLDFHFLAAVQVAVYAGGIMVLFIFSILLTNHPGSDVKFEKPGRMALAAVAAMGGLALCGAIIVVNVRKMAAYVSQYAGDVSHSMEETGKALLGTGENGYVLPFEAISLLLLACIIGGIMIARKQ
jgi:NADH-quinone oxidoreductase subunit J